MTVALKKNVGLLWYFGFAKGFNSAIEMMGGLIEMQDACFLSYFPLPVKFLLLPLPCWLLVDAAFLRRS